MLITKKITALALALVFMLSALCGCDVIGNTTDDVPSIPEKDSEVYTVSVNTVFATNDDKMKPAIDALNSAKSTIYVDRTGFIVESSSSLDGISVEEKYTYINSELYRALSITVDERCVNSLEKAAMADEDKNILLMKVGDGASIDLSDFLTLECNSYGRTTEYVCTDITDSAKESLCKILASDLSESGASVTLEEASCIIETEGELLMKSTLSASFVILIDATTYEITMRRTASYNYDSTFSVTPPENADEYSTVTAEDILR